MRTTENILLTMMAITGYQGDKEEVVKNIQLLIMAEAMEELLSLKAEAVQAEITDALKEAPQQSEEHTRILYTYFDRQVVDEAVKKSAEKVFSEIFADLIPQLSGEERHNLEAYFAALSS